MSFEKTFILPQGKYYIDYEIDITDEFYIQTPELIDLQEDTHLIRNYSTSWVLSNTLITDIAFGNNIYVGTNNGKVYTSSDAINWTLQYSYSSPAGVTSCISFGNNVFCIITKYNEIITSIISSDGINWTVTNHNFGSNVYNAGPSWLYFFNGYFIAYCGNINNIDISMDGINWERKLSNVIFANGCSGNSLFIIKDNYYNKFYYSSDAINWNSTTNSISSLSSKSLYFYNSLFYGNFGNIIYTTSDAINWNIFSSISSITYSFIKTNKYYFANINQDLYKSLDGINWNLIKPLGSSIDYSNYKAFYINNLYIIATASKTFICYNV